MIKLEDQLKNLPEEFTYIMEEIKDKNFDNILSYILEQYEIDKQFNELEDNFKADFTTFLKQLYLFGFYSGVSFTISPYDYVKDLNDKMEES